MVRKWSGNGRKQCIDIFTDTSDDMRSTVEARLMEVELRRVNGFVHTCLLSSSGTEERILNRLEELRVLNEIYSMF